MVIIFTVAATPIRDLTKDEVISPEELRDLQLRKADFLLFDARDSKAYDEAHIEGAILPLPREYYRQRELFRSRIIETEPDLNATLAEATRTYPKEIQMVTYCNSNCKASAFLLLQLKALGFNHVRAMEAGISTWEAKGYPAVQGVPRLASDSLN